MIITSASLKVWKNRNLMSSSSRCQTCDLLEFSYFKAWASESDHVNDKNSELLSDLYKQNVAVIYSQSRFVSTLLTGLSCIFYDLLFKYEQASKARDAEKLSNILTKVASAPCHTLFGFLGIKIFHAKPLIVNSVSWLKTTRSAHQTFYWRSSTRTDSGPHCLVAVSTDMPIKSLQGYQINDGKARFDYYYAFNEIVTLFRTGKESV